MPGVAASTSAATRVRGVPSGNPSLLGIPARGKGLEGDGSLESLGLEEAALDLLGSVFCAMTPVSTTITGPKVTEVRVDEMKREKVKWKKNQKFKAKKEVSIESKGGRGRETKPMQQ